jgi:hypothetical protein
MNSTDLQSLLKAAKLITPLRREIVVVPRVMNEADGTVEFVASDETLDSYREIIRAGGWKFDLFAKNAPFVDSHDYSSITKLLGQVTDWRVDRKQLVETVKYARQPDTLAEWAFKMVRDGFLKAVSVGFVPVKMASKWDQSPGAMQEQLAALGLDAGTAAAVRAVYIEQQQIELSQCVIGANPNALAKAYKAGCLTEGDLDKFSAMIANTQPAAPANDSEVASAASPRTKLAILAATQTQF